MGSAVDIIVHGVDHDDGPVLLDRAVERLGALERAWSRFLPDSELSRINRAAGAPGVVGPDTMRLVELSVAAWADTGGRFDPTTGRALVAAGYDRSFDEIPAPDVAFDRSRMGRLGVDGCGVDEHGCLVAGPPPVVPGCGGIAVVADLGVVHLPPGVTIDPGGIGKGLAADLVAGELLESGAAGALVSVGGDLRAAGVAPEGAWEVAFDHAVAPGDGRGVAAVGRIGLVEGAVATSSILRRRWRSNDGPAHHVIDPRTGRPTAGGALACTVVAGEAWHAEALATAVLVAWEEPDGSDVASALLGDAAAALVTVADGGLVRFGSGTVVRSIEVAA